MAVLYESQNYGLQTYHSLYSRCIVVDRVYKVRTVDCMMRIAPKRSLSWAQSTTRQSGYRLQSYSTRRFSYKTRILCFVVLHMRE